MLLSCVVWVHGIAAVASGGERAIGPELAAQLSEILSAPAAQNAKVGVYVRRLDDGAEVFAKEADTLLIPASNMKIVTTAAALHTLGPDYRFATEVYGEPDAQGTLNGDLWIRGNGDPSLVPERLWYLAGRIFYAGLRELRGDIIVDDTYFAGPRLAAGFEQDRSSMAYMAPMGAVSVGFNALQVHVLPGSVAGAGARVLLDPPSDYATVEGSVTTVTRGRTSINVDVVPSGDRSIVRVAGRVHQNDEGRTFWRRVDHPPVYTGEVLKRALEQQGIRVLGRVKLGTLPEGKKRLVTLPSPRLAEIVNWLNKNSNNFVAEQVALAVGAARFGAPSTLAKAQAAIEAFLREEVKLEGDFRVGNASGLHDVNRMSPRMIVQVLDVMWRKPHVLPEFVSSLAVAGGSGTLAERMQKTQAAHILRAKTGTLSSASALSGYVQAKSGETLAFSILVNDYQTPISQVWEVQDHIGAALAGTSFVPDGMIASQKARPAAELTEVVAP